MRGRGALSGFLCVLLAAAACATGGSSWRETSRATCAVVGGLIGGAAGAVVANPHHTDDEDSDAVVGGAVGAQIRPDARVILDVGAQTLGENPGVRVEVAGHTDSAGSEEYNQQLSLRRARAVRDYLVSKGVDASRLRVSGYGETRPVADNATREGRAQNRRVELNLQ